MARSGTDQHWSDRAISSRPDVHVNVGDIYQRELEYDGILPHLQPGDHLLEVGCGMGFSTERFRGRVKHIDAFDSSEEMIVRAKEVYGETNNRFFVDNVLDPQLFARPYDAIVCVRVLINLRNLDEQRRALRNLRDALRPGGRLLLVEGFVDGFEEISRVRERVGLPPVQPARINFYSRLSEIVDQLEDDFEQIDSFHLGMYDYLTRVVFPAAVGPENARANTPFSEACMHLCREKNPDELMGLSRICGFVLRRPA